MEVYLLLFLKYSHTQPKSFPPALQPGIYPWMFLWQYISTSFGLILTRMSTTQLSDLLQEILHEEAPSAVGEVGTR